MSAGACSNSVPETCSKVRVWDLPTKFFEVARMAMSQRVSLVPYMYNQIRKAYDTGISPIFPMYYNFPQFDNAYLTNAKVRNGGGACAHLLHNDPPRLAFLVFGFFFFQGDYSQYFLGDDMIASPVVTPAGEDSMAQTKVWLPPGTWYEHDTGVLRTGAADGSTILVKKVRRAWAVTGPSKS